MLWLPVPQHPNTHIVSHSLVTLTRSPVVLDLFSGLRSFRVRLLYSTLTDQWRCFFDNLVLSARKYRHCDSCWIALCKQGDFGYQTVLHALGGVPYGHQQEPRRVYTHLSFIV